MVAGAHADPFAVEDLRNVVRVDPGNVEREDAHAVIERLRAEHGDAGDREQLRQRVAHQGALVLVDPRHSNALEVVDRRAQPDRIDVR